MSDASERICIECGKPRGASGAREMCQPCYRRWKKTYTDLGLPLPPAPARKSNRTHGQKKGAERNCLEPGCPDPVGPHGARGRCPKHYAEARGAATCSTEGCTNPIGKAGARGMCSMCYQRWRNSFLDQGLPLPPMQRGQPIFADGTKNCTKCGKRKPLGEFYWDRSRNKPNPTCIECRRAYDNRHNRRLAGRPDDWVAPKSKGRPPKPEGYTFVSQGYVMIKKTGHHRAKKNGWVREHIVVAEEKYGIRITEDFTVHHKNGNTQDNRPENLELRVGRHGKHADAVDGILESEMLRARAVEVLEQYGYRVTAPPGLQVVT